MRCLSYILLCLCIAYKCLAFVRSPRAVSHLRLECSSRLGDLKHQLYQVALKSNRGERLDENLKERAMDIISQLEMQNPSYEKGADFSMLGRWELVFTDGQLFQSSPFFLALRQLFSSEDGEKANHAFSLHRAATSTGQIERVVQIITEEEVISEVGLRVGLLPGIPFAVEGTVVSKASYESFGKFSMRLRLKDTAVVRSNLPYVGNLVEDISLPTGSILSGIKRDASEATLVTYFLDESLRITRNSDDVVFVYSRET